MKTILINILIVLTLSAYNQNKVEIPFSDISISQDKDDIINNSTNKAPCSTTAPNDNCASATSLTVGVACVTQSTCSATIEVGEPAPICDVTQDQTIWYTFVATNENMTTIIDINGSSCFVTSAVYSGTCGSFTQLSCADNALILNNFLVGLVIGDTYYLQVAYGSGGPCGNETIPCISVEETPDGASCNTASPFCTGSAETFTAEIGSVAPDGPDYGCLLAQPNPTWFYLEIGVAGDIEITMTNSNTVDIDFIFYGPFTDIVTACNSLTAGSIIDCSFSTSATEVGDITGATIGDVYIAMVTNYSNSPTDITFNQTSGTGETDCTILPVDFIAMNVSCNTISWATVSETNNDYYLVYHSFDNADWNMIDKEYSSNENTTPLLYKINNEDGFDNGYYMLSQTDYNGTTDTLSVEYLNCYKGKGTVLEKVYTIEGKLLGSKIPTKSGLYIFKYSDGTINKREIINIGE